MWSSQKNGLRLQGRELAAKISAVAFEALLQPCDVELPRRHARLEREMRRRARRLPHDEARSAHARGRLAAVRHRGAAAGDEQIVDLLRHDHTVGQLIEPSFLSCKNKLTVAGDGGLDRPAVDADGVGEVDAIEYVVLREHVFAAPPPRLADADLRRDLDDVGVLEARGGAADEL